MRISCIHLPCIPSYSKHSKLFIISYSTYPNSTKHVPFKSLVCPNFEYYAIFNSYEAYITFSFEYMQTLNQNFICNDNEFTHKLNFINTLCELQFLNSKSRFNLSKCNVRIIKSFDTYCTRLNTNNNWIFSTNKMENLTILCNVRWYNVQTGYDNN